MALTRLTRAQGFILVAHLVLALMYGALNPPWEAHDETGHFAYVNFVAQNRALPDAYGSDKVLFDQSHQPPAYYVLAALLTGWMKRDDGVGPQFNRFALDGTNRRGARIMLRQTGEIFPWTGTILALHGARVVSALLTTLTILLIALGANMIFGRGSAAALLAMAFAAFDPQVIFMGAMVNNDAMVTMAGASVAYFMLRPSTTKHLDRSAPSIYVSTDPEVRAESRGASGPNVSKPTRVPLRAPLDSARSLVRSSLKTLSALRSRCIIGFRRNEIAHTVGDYLLLGLSLGLAFLSKNSAIALIGFVAVALAFIGWRKRWPVRDVLVHGAITAAAFAMLAVPFTIYNLSRYGRVLVDRNINNPILSLTNQTSVIGAGVNQAITDGWIPQLFANTFNTFWGKFGWGNVGLPDVAYWVLAAVCVVGVLGCIIGWRRAPRETRTALTLLLLFSVSMMALPLYRAIYFQDPALLPGRYLMPALMAYAALLGFGWAEGSKLVISNWMRSRPTTHYPVTYLLITLLAVFALLTPFAFILPRYAPVLITPTTAPAVLRFADVAEVIDVQARTVNLPDREGMRHYARVRLTWRALTATLEHWVFGIDVLGRDNEALGSINVYPNKGNYPSTNWRAGDTFVDEYDILLEKPCARLPSLGRVNVKVFQFAAASDTGTITLTKQLPALDGTGRVISPIIGRFKIDDGPQLPVWWQEPIAKFGGIWLRDVQQPATAKPGDTITLTLTYEMVRQDDKAGTAFVHLLDANGQPLAAQDDHVPQFGTYPTDLWDAGECVREPFVLTIPQNAVGPVRVVTGFYDLNQTRFKTGTRDDLVTLGEIKLVR